MQLSLLRTQADAPPKAMLLALGAARHATVVLLLALLASFANSPSFAEQSTRRDVTVSGDQSKQQFVTGDRIHIHANISDEVFALGHEIVVEGTQAETAYLAGDTVLVKDSTLADLIAGAHDQVEISGTIRDDALVAICPICPGGSGRLFVGPQGHIGGDAHFLANTLEIQGTVDGDLAATARRIVISGTIGGTADLTAREIIIASGARIGGELVARSPSKPQIESGAIISGPLREIETEVDIPDLKELPKVIGWVGAAAAGILLLGAFLLGALAQLTVPGPLNQAARIMKAELWTCLWRGLACALILPIIGAVLAMSLVGFPAGVVLMAMLVVLSAFAFVASAYAIGLWLRSLITAAAPEPRTSGRIGWTLAGILTLFILWIVPFVGWIVALLTLLGGLGAVAMTLWRLIRGPDAPVALDNPGGVLAHGFGSEPFPAGKD